MTKSVVAPTYAYQNRTTQHQPPLLPSQSPFIPRHFPPGCCTSLPPAGAVPPHFHYAPPVHHHPQQGMYAGGGQSAGARCASRQCDVTSMPPPPAAPSTANDNMVELNPFQLMTSAPYSHRCELVHRGVGTGGGGVSDCSGAPLTSGALGQCSAS